MASQPHASDTAEGFDALLRRVLDQVPGIVWSTDCDLRITSSFGGGLAALNLPPGQLVGTTLSEFFRTADPKAPPIAAHRRAMAGESVCFEHTWAGRTHRMRVSPLQDAARGIIGCTGFAQDITQQKQTQERLDRIEWLLTRSEKPETAEEHRYVPPYGNLVELNSCRLLGDIIGEEILSAVARDCLDLLDTSAAVYEKNGDYALGIFASGWCRLLDSASRNLCGSENNREALTCGKWHCHESCWTEASRVSIETGQPVDIECRGGIRLFAVPIWGHGEVVGSVNIGYGDPPRDPQKLREIAERYDLTVDQLRRQAESYDSRPPLMIDIAKNHLFTCAKLMGEIVKRKRAELELEKHREYLEDLVEARTAELREINQELQREISERKQGEETLRESDERYRTLAEAAQDSICIIHRDDRIAYVNSFGAQQFGLQPQEVIGRPREDLFSPETNDLQRPYLERVFRTGEPNYAEEKHIFGDREVWMGTRLVPLRGETDEVNAVLGISRDITARKGAEEVLRESEERFREVLEHSQDALYKRNLETGQYEYMSPAIARITGYTPDEAMAMGPDEIDSLVHPEDIRWINDLKRKALETTEGHPGVGTAEYRVKCKGGSFRWISEHYALRRDSVGGPLFSVASVRDVTEGKRAEEELRNSRDSLAEAQRIAHLGSWEWDIEGNKLSWSEEAYRIFGLNHGEFTGDYDGFFKWVHPDDKGRVGKAVKEAVSEGKPIDFEHRIVLSDGTERTIHERGEAVYDQLGNVVELAGTCYDITERKQAEEALRESEERFRTLFECAPDGIYLNDMEGRFVDGNGTAEELTGYSRAELIGKSFAQAALLSAEDLERALSALGKVFRGEPTGPDEFRLRRKDGTFVPVEIRAFPVRIDNQVLSLGIARDITERKQAEEALRRTETELAHAGRLAAMGEMVAGIAHEVNQPLYSILNFAKAGKNVLAAEGQPNLDDLRQWNDEIATAAADASEILDRLRGYARKTEPSRVCICACDLIEEAVELLGFEARQRQIAVDFERCETPVFVHADRVQIQEVLVNLLRNAYEAIERVSSGSPQVTIRVRPADQFVEVSVADTGPGLPPDDQLKIFDPFVTTKPDGLGMGLAISRTIVEAHGGKLWAGSNPEQGAAFHFTLPVDNGGAN